MIRLLTWLLRTRGDPHDLHVRELKESVFRLEEQLRQQNESNPEVEETKKRNQEAILPTNCFKKTGRVTSIKGDHFIIDGNYFVPKTQLKNVDGSERVEEGTRLSYLAYRKEDPASGESTVMVVKIVSVVDEMWTDGGLPAKETSWEDKDTKAATGNSTVYYNRNHRREPGKVITKEGGVLSIETDAGEPLSVDMDKTRMSFIPVLGDYVTLDCLVQMDDGFVDFKGELLEVVAIEPSRTVSGTGKVSSSELGGGEITTRSGKFVFQSDCLANSYRPAVGDTVAFQAVENEIVEMRCITVKLVEAVSTTDKRLRPGNGDLSHTSKTNERGHDQTNRENLWEDKRGIKIVGDFDVKLTDMNATVVRKVTVKNESKDTRHRILECLPLNKFAKPSWVSLKSPPTYSQTILLPGETVEYVFDISGGNFFGRQREGWMWSFGGNFQIRRTFLIKIDGQMGAEDSDDDGDGDADSSEKTRFNKRQSYLQQKLAALNMRRNRDTARVVSGQHVFKRANFVAFSFPMYTVPPDMFEVVLTTASTEELRYALSKAPYCLDEPLSTQNYARLYGNFIFLEEINQFIEFRKHDIERGHFAREDNYLALHVQNIAEARPSVLVGDTVHASAPWNQDGKDNSTFQGIIHKVLQNRVLLKFDANFQARYNGESYHITFSFGRGTYRKQHHAISRVKLVMGLDYLFPDAIELREPLLNVQLNEREELVLADEGDTRVRVLPWHNEKLNRNQKMAIANVLRGETRPLPYVIFGPPGTGKTITTIELIHQLAINSPDCRVIVATPSNSAAYLITERLARGGVLKAGDFIRLVSMNQVERESIPEHLAPYCATVDVAEERNTKGTVLTTESGLRMKLQAKHIGRHRVTISTCSCMGVLMQLRFPRNHFTHVIIDEAGQALEPDTLIPITLINRIVGSVTLVGDPKQLGPVVLAFEAKTRGYDISWLERLLCTSRPYCIDKERFPDTHGYNPRLVTKLCINYRSTPSVLSLYSDMFYDSLLVPEQTEATAQDSALLTALHEILHVPRPTADFGVFFCGIDGTNKQAPDSPSWFSPAEASMVHRIVENLYRKGYEPSDIGIITPYVMQVKTIRRIFEVASLDPPKVGSVEEFQGQERKVVIMSTVRSSRALLAQDKGAVLGFVAAPKRVNVAISRAKVALVIVGNPKLLGIDRTWVQVLRYAVNQKTYVGCTLSTSLLATISESSVNT